MREKRIAVLFLLFLLVGSCLCFGAILTPTGTQAAPNMGGLPPRTTPGPQPTPEPITTPTSPDGGVASVSGDAPGSVIELRIAANGPDWQRLWTVVQWQDALGEWHDVTGWQGIPDDVLKTDYGYYIVKLWWVGERDTNTGPFRWLVYQQGAVGSKSDNRGTCPMSSAPFNLPATGQFATVDIALREASPCLAESGTLITPSGAGMAIASTGLIQSTRNRAERSPSCKNGYGCDCALPKQVWPDMDMSLQMAMSRALCEPTSCKDERP